MELAIRADNALNKAHNRLRVVYITSASNPADEPSRKLAVKPEKFVSMWKLIDLHFRGIPLDLWHKPFKSKMKNSSSHREGLRHVEMEQADVSSTEDDDDREICSNSDSASNDEVLDIYYGVGCMDEL